MQLRRAEASNEAEAASLSKERQDWESWQDKRDNWGEIVKKQDAKTQKTLADERAAMEREDERRQKSFNTRVKARAKQKVNGFYASYAAICIYGVVLSIYTYVRSGGYKHFLSFFEFFAGRFAEDTASGVVSTILCVGIPLGLLIYSLVLYHRLDHWGQHNINAALIICAVMFMFGAWMPFNSFGAMLLINIGYLLASGVLETIVHPRY